MKVLISAYACEPDKGSEPEIGLRAALAAAHSHHVWVVTRTNNAATVRDWLRSNASEAHIEVIGIDLQGTALRMKKHGLIGLHWYYHQWQRLLLERARHLDDDIHFDVTHHVTFASAWTRTGISRLDKPFVWGPVGGGVEAPLGLTTELGARGLLEECLRVPVRRGALHTAEAHTTQRRAAVVLAQNTATANKLQRSRYVRILPNALAVQAPVPSDRYLERNKDVLMAGRLLPWKAGKLALRTLGKSRHSATRLHVYGSGPDLRRLQNLANAWGLSHRVIFHGPVPRPVLINALSSAGLLLHPALHDDSPGVIAEALSLGTPVVCLNHGGPAEIITHWPVHLSRAVTPTTPQQTAASLARDMDDLLEKSFPIASRAVLPIDSFSETLLEAYDLAWRTFHESARQ